MSGGVILSAFRSARRRLFWLIPAADERALRRLSAVYTAIGPSPDLRDRVLAAHATSFPERTYCDE